MKVLIADDSRISRHLLCSALNSWGYDVVATRDGEGAWNELENGDSPRLAVLDWYMPQMDGVEICRKLRQREASPYVYVILLTTACDREHLLEGLAAGADDFLTKPFDAQELEQRLRAGVRIVDLQDKLLATQASLRIQATQDGLTGIWNRRAILETLDRELFRARRDGTSIGLGMVDLDHFKQINDTYGHQAGDAVLQQAAKILCAELRTYDVLGRYGGEEFLFVLPNTELSTAADVAERLRTCFESNPIIFDGNAIPVALSIGVTAVEVEHGVTADALIKSADEQLYRAKEEGRNCVRSPVSTLRSPAAASETSGLALV